MSVDSEINLESDFTLRDLVKLKRYIGIIRFTLQSETKNSHIDGELLEIKENTTLEYTSDRVAEITENTITLTNIPMDSFKINQRCC